MFVLFVAQWARGPLWAKRLDPRPTVGYRTRPKAQPIRGLGWVVPGPTWALMKPIRMVARVSYLFFISLPT
jgi:hypothetical protein